MPNYDRTGPVGEGPMTGRLGGLCGGGALRGKGRRCRRGAGRGMGVGLAGQVGPERGDQRRALKAERNRLKTLLARTEDRLRDLSASAAEKHGPEGD